MTRNTENKSSQTKEERPERRNWTLWPLKGAQDRILEPLHNKTDIPLSDPAAHL